MCCRSGWVGLGCVGLGWVGMGWDGLGCVGMGWVVLGWDVLGWDVLSWLGWVGLRCVVLGWAQIWLWLLAEETLECTSPSAQLSKIYLGNTSFVANIPFACTSRARINSA